MEFCSLFFFLAQCATNTYRLKFNFFVTETLEMHEVVLIMATQGIEQKIMGFMGWGVQFVQSSALDHCICHHKSGISVNGGVLIVDF